MPALSALIVPFFVAASQTPTPPPPLTRQKTTHGRILATIGVGEGLVSPLAYGARVWGEKIPRLIAVATKRLVASGPIAETRKGDYSNDWVSVRPD